MKVICNWPFTRPHSRGRPGPTDCGMAYARGLRRLGHEVYLFEEVGPRDCTDDSYNEVPFESWGGARYFEGLAKAWGMWPRACLLYDGGKATRGLSFKEAVGVADEVDLLLDIANSLHNRELVERIPRRAFIDEAPAKTQAFHHEYGIDQGFAHHDFFFSVGLNLGRADCEVPACGVEWRGIVHPVVLSMWPAQIDECCERFTTVSNWVGKETFVLNGRYSGDKADQWQNYLDLPSRIHQPLEVALNIKQGWEGDLRLFTDRGWLVTDARRFLTFEDYHRYIGSSRAEFSVANNRYVEFRTGWTSDRTARYLASGKPALVQSTGIEEHLPTGKGLLTFSDPDEAVAGVHEINADYLGHCRAARAIAEEYFDSEKVLTGMLRVMDLA